MGHKTHPVGFRLGISRDWQARWFVPNGKRYREMVLSDLSIRKAITNCYSDFSDSGIANVEIERDSQDIIINVHSARPGITIGRDGERVKKLRSTIESITNKRIQLNIIEIQQPELNAYLVAKNIAEQLQRRVAHRRTMRQAIQRAMQGGAQGIKIIIKGRIMGAEIARSEKAMEGRVPLHTLNAIIDYDFAEAATVMGRIGVKVWIYKGNKITEPVNEQTDEIKTIEVTVRGEETSDVTAEADQVS